jgi:hypothetical protein
VGTIFTFGSDIPVCAAAWLWLLPCRVRFVFACWLFVCPGVSGHAAAVCAGDTGADRMWWWRVLCWAGRVVGGLGRPCGGGQCGECLAAPAPGFRGQALGGAAGVFLLPGVPGVQDALVADDEQVVAAGRRVLRRGEDLGSAAVKEHGREAEGAADAAGQATRW